VHTIRPPRTPSSQYIVAAGDRIAIVAGLAFVEGVAHGGFGAAELQGWIETHLVRPKRMVWSGEIHEPGFGVIRLQHTGLGAPGVSEAIKLQGLISTARKRVVLALRGLMATPIDDRFLNAAIYSGRVKRETQGTSAGWVPQPKASDGLSDTVLSLFAADILSHRETYERGLCVCNACGRVWFDPMTEQRQSCPLGVPHHATESGESAVSGSIAPPERGSPLSPRKQSS
jgi:hypothetical protein